MTSPHSPRPTTHNPALHITSSECNPTQLTFGRIVTQADTAILKEAREDIDALEHVVKSLATSLWRESLARSRFIHSMSSFTSGAISLRRAASSRQKALTSTQCATPTSRACAGAGSRDGGPREVKNLEEVIRPRLS